MSDEQRGRVAPEPLTAEQRSSKKSWLRRHLMLWVVLLLAIAIAVNIYAIRGSTERRRDACFDLEALKTITRNEKTAQIAKTARILRQHHINLKHPEGKVFGIPAKLLVQGNEEQKAVVQQLAPKDC